MPIVKQCVQCGKDFSVTPSRASAARFCSNPCAASQRVRRESVTCASCGKTYETKRHRVGHTKTCSRRCQRALHDLTGRRMGRLTVVAEADGLGRGRRWLCVCDCGDQSVRNAGDILSRERDGIELQCMKCWQNHLAKLNRERLSRDGAIAKFQARIDKRGGDECWPYMGARCRDGYGSLRLGGVQTSAHRLAYTLAFGEIPPGAHVRHKCDNPPCCNPAHLEAGSQLDNMRDKAERGRGRTLPRPGESSPTAKLTWEAVRIIRGSPAPRAELAAQFGVSASNISMVLAGKTWKE